MNDERREHGAVDEFSLEQQIRESNDHTLIVGLMSVRPAVRKAVRQKSCSFRILFNPVTRL